MGARWLNPSVHWEGITVDAPKEDDGAFWLVFSKGEERCQRVALIATKWQETVRRCIETGKPDWTPSGLPAARAWLRDFNFVHPRTDDGLCLRLRSPRDGEEIFLAISDEQAERIAELLCEWVGVVTATEGS